METNTVEATPMTRLRNQLTPLFTLVQVVMESDRPDLKNLAQVCDLKKIKKLLQAIEDGDLSDRESSFRTDLQRLLNAKSMENGSNTPDYILAGFLLQMLKAFNASTLARDEHIKPKLDL